MDVMLISSFNSTVLENWVPMPARNETSISSIPVIKTTFLSVPISLLPIRPFSGFVHINFPHDRKVIENIFSSGISANKDAFVS